MSDLRPRGVPIVINGEERHLLFTLNAIDKVQSKYGKDASEVLDQIAGEYPEGRTILEGAPVRRLKYRQVKVLPR